MNKSIVQVNPKNLESLQEFLALIDEIKQDFVNPGTHSSVAIPEAFKLFSIKKEITLLYSFYEVTGFDLPEYPYKTSGDRKPEFLNGGKSEEPWEYNFSDVKFKNRHTDETFEDIIPKDALEFLINNEVLSYKKYPWEEFYEYVFPKESLDLKSPEIMSNFFSRFLAGDDREKVLSALNSLLGDSKAFPPELSQDLQNIYNTLLNVSKPETLNRYIRNIRQFNESLKSE